MAQRYEVRPFTPDLIDDAARLRAADHRRHRRFLPALDPAYEDAGAIRPLIAAMVDAGATGVFVTSGAAPAAYLIASERPGAGWGRNAWVDAPGTGGADSEAIREAYAHAARAWVDAGRTSHYVVVNARDQVIVDAWFRLSFGLQHVHALRARAPDDFGATQREGLQVRPIERRDLREVAELGLVLPLHVTQSPVFSEMPLQTIEEMEAEAEEDFGDPRFTELVAVRAGRVIGVTICCSITESPGNTALMRPPNAGFLGHAAVSNEARGLGAGRALGEAVVAWSRDEGHDWVGADWRSTNLEADRTWRSLGFSPSFYRLHRLIG